MSSTATLNRVNALLTKADEAIEATDLQLAAETLREASHLDPENAQLKSRWTRLQHLDRSDDGLERLRMYLSSHVPEDGRKAQQALEARQLPKQDAIQAAKLFLSPTDPLEHLDALAGALFTRNVEARRVVAMELHENATETFNLLCSRGEQSFNTVTSIPVEDSLWHSNDAQATAQVDVFRLCIATLIEAGADHLERAMRSITRLLSMVSATVASVIDDDVLDAILSCLDIRQPAALRSQTMLATSKLLEATQQQNEEMFSQFITRRVSKQTNDDLIIAFSAAAAAFPVIPTVVSKLFLIDGFVQELVPNLERNWDDGAAGMRKSHVLETSALELLSAACVDKSCREAIQRYCTHWLENLVDERQGTHKALAALILAKISAGCSQEVSTKLEQLVLSGDPEMDQAIEGLAYTSLQPKIKEDIAKNTKLIQQLVRALKGRSAITFGCLTVFSNITSYRPSLSEEQKKMSQLKAYANSERPAPQNPLDDDKHVTARCRKLLDEDLVPALLACCKQSTSPSNVALVVRIMLALAREQKHRAKMSQQGAVRLLLQIRDRVAKTDKSTSEASAVERDAAHALARLLISVNPSHVFSAGLPATSAVSALVPLLSYDQDAEQRNLLPTFEALLALTNLASMEENSIRDLELRLVWSQLEDHLLLSSNVLVQRASVELVCNLMASPNCVAKFVGDGTKREGTRMQILLALADVEDFATRRASGGALAMLTEWDSAVTAILEQSSDSGPKGVKVLLRMCADESDELKHRGFACLANIVNAPGDISKKGVEKIKEEGGVQVLREALKSTKNRDVMAVGVEVIKKTM